MNKCCKTCKHAKLVCHKDLQKEFVGCLMHYAVDEDLIWTKLEKACYTSSNKLIYIGWIYAKVPFEDRKESYTVMTPQLVANGLILPKGAVCKLWESKCESESKEETVDLNIQTPKLEYASEGFTIIKR